MKTPKHINSMWLADTCIGIGMHKWNEYMEGTTKANADIIERHIKEHCPDIAHSLCLEGYNPYRHDSVKKEGLLVYVHSSIEYFFEYN